MTSQLLVKMRKKPRQARAAATIDAIIEAAAQLLQKEGEEALTTAKIAARAGVAIGSIYQYFPNKDAILAALIMKEREAVAAEVAKNISLLNPKNGEEVIRSIIKTVVAAFRPRRKRRRLVAIGAALRAGRDDSGAALLDRIGTMMLDASRVHKDFSPRPLTPTSVYVLTRAVMGAVRAAVVENAKILDDPEFEEELTRLAIGYLRA